MIQVFLAMKMGIEFRRRQIHVPSLSNCDVLKDAKGRLGGGGGGGGGGRRKKYQEGLMPSQTKLSANHVRQREVYFTHSNFAIRNSTNKPGFIADGYDRFTARYPGYIKEPNYSVYPKSRNLNGRFYNSTNMCC